MPTIDELLQQRYGQGRFNPGAGQTQMSFQEWMDRHPSLQGRGGNNNFGAYQSAITEGAGTAVPGGDPGAPQQFQGTPGVTGTGQLGPGPATPGQPPAPAGGVDLGSPEVLSQMGPPDAPPSAPNPHPNVGQGMDYKTFLSKRGVAGRKSSATNAAAWRRTQGKKPPKGPSGGSGTQQAH